MLRRLTDWPPGESPAVWGARVKGVTASSAPDVGPLASVLRNRCPREGRPSLRGAQSASAGAPSAPTMADAGVGGSVPARLDPHANAMQALDMPLSGVPPGVCTGACGVPDLGVPASGDPVAMDRRLGRAAAGPADGPRWSEPAGLLTATGGAFAARICAAADTAMGLPARTWEASGARDSDVAPETPEASTGHACTDLCGAAVVPDTSTGHAFMDCGGPTVVPETSTGQAFIDCGGAVIPDASGWSTGHAFIDPMHVLAVRVRAGLLSMGRAPWVREGAGRSLGDDEEPD